MELVPEEELQTSAPDGPNSLVDRRALKVLTSIFLSYSLKFLGDSWLV